MMLAGGRCAARSSGLGLVPRQLRRSLTTLEGVRAYRNVLRARAVAFRGDVEALEKSRDEVRKKFEEDRDETDPEKILAKLKEAEDLVAFLRENVLQGELQDFQNDDDDDSVEVRGKVQYKFKPKTALTTDPCGADALRPVEA